MSRLQELAADLARRKESRPLDFAKRIPWQKVVWSLIGGAPWQSEWGDAPSRPPSLICVPCSNRVGKSTFGGMALSGALTERLPRFVRSREFWGGMPTLADSVAIQRPHVEAWLGLGDGASWTPKRANAPVTSVVKTREGRVLRLKSYDQGDATSKSGGAWESGKVGLIVLDEPFPDHVLHAARTRLIDEDGLMLALFTPLTGTQSALYKECHEPWQAYKKQNPTAKWGEVRPGVWVVSVGMRDNAKSVGGFLPDEAIDREEAALVAAGRGLEARVRFHGDWIDTSEDRLIPADQLRVFYPEDEPRGGWADKIAHVDTASSTKESADETAVSVWARSHQGLLYQLASEHGRWEPFEKARKIADVLIANGCPNTWVDRQTGDMEFAAALNRELSERGHRACVQVAESKTIDKVTAANLFAPMVANGQVLVRPQHLEGENSFGSQARMFSASYKGHDDTLDAGMKAALRLAGETGTLYDHAAAIIDEAGIETDIHGRPKDDDDLDSIDPRDFRMSRGLLGPD